MRGSDETGGRELETYPACEKALSWFCGRPEKSASKLSWRVLKLSAYPAAAVWQVMQSVREG